MTYSFLSPFSASTSWKECWAFMTGLRYSPLHVTELCGEMQGNFKVGCARLTRFYFQALPLINFNLGQNKMEQLSPFPPKAMMKARRSKSAPLWHHWSGGRGGTDVSFISSKIVGSISAALSTRVQCTSPNFLSQPEKKNETWKVGRGKGPSKRKAKRQEKFRNGQCPSPPPPPQKKKKKKKMAYVRWQIKILYILVCHLREIYLFGKKKIAFSAKLRPN